ncbi:MAG: hypothetical protein ABR921_08770 [Candidatus Sulfotelmatobacter sp.]
MGDLRDLYQEVILEHSKAPRNYRELKNPDRKAEGFFRMSCFKARDARSRKRRHR